VALAVLSLAFLNSESSQRLLDLWGLVDIPIAFISGLWNSLMIPIGPHVSRVSTIPYLLWVVRGIFRESGLPVGHYGHRAACLVLVVELPCYRAFRNWDSQLSCAVFGRGVCWLPLAKQD